MTLVRTYANSDTMDSQFFVGREVERTEQYGEPTLFVRGYSSYHDIVKTAGEQGVTHIYFGADHSYSVNSQSEGQLWQMMIKGCLDAGYACTLDIPQSRAYDIVGSELLAHPKFHLQIIVKLPYIERYNSRTRIKIDDQQFNSSNSHVWSVPVSTVCAEQYATPWSAYSADRVI